MPKVVGRFCGGEATGGSAAAPLDESRLLQAEARITALEAGHTKLVGSLTPVTDFATQTTHYGISPTFVQGN